MVKPNFFSGTTGKTKDGVAIGPRDPGPQLASATNLLCNFDESISCFWGSVSSLATMESIIQYIQFFLIHH